MTREQMPPEIRGEVRQLCRLLQETIRARFPQEAESRVPGGRQGLEALCADESELRMADVYGILRILGVPPTQFFGELRRVRELSTAAPAAPPRR